MKEAEEKAVKRVSVRIRIGGRNKPVQKEALVHVKSGKVIGFVQKTHP